MTYARLTQLILTNEQAEITRDECLNVLELSSMIEVVYEKGFMRFYEGVRIYVENDSLNIEDKQNAICIKCPDQMAIYLRFHDFDRAYITLGEILIKLVI